MFIYLNSFEFIENFIRNRNFDSLEFGVNDPQVLKIWDGLMYRCWIDKILSYKKNQETSSYNQPSRELFEHLASNGRNMEWLELMIKIDIVLLLPLAEIVFSHFFFKKTFFKKISFF